MPKIKFKESGKWADRGLNGSPQFEVEAGAEREVSTHLADLAISSGKAVLVAEYQPATKKKSKRGPRAKSERNPAQQDKVRSES